MAVKWMVDEASERQIWAEIRRESVEAVSKAPPGRILDLGGGPGSFTKHITSEVGGLEPVSIDIVRPDVQPACEFVLGDALRLPFRDATFSAVAARAVLHHFPDHLDASMAELERVLVPGGVLVVQEPCSGNPFAAAARALFPTDRHDPGEKPLPSGAMLRAVEARFGEARADGHFIASYLAPHLLARLDARSRGTARKLIFLLFRADRALLGKSRMARRAAAYVHISATKGKK